MIGLIKKILFTSFVIFALSITYKEKTLFSYVYVYTSQISNPTQKIITDYFNKTTQSTKKISSDLFDNSIPKFKDSVTESLSAPLKNEDMRENVNDEDKRKLDSLLKQEE